VVTFRAVFALVLCIWAYKN